MNLLEKILALSGCHQIPERCFKFRGQPMRMCARCLGVFGGQAIAIVTAICFGLPSPWILIAMLIPMGIDWGIQEFFRVESTNYRRLFTGIVGGFGLFSIYIWGAIKIFRFIEGFLRQI